MVERFIDRKVLVRSAEAGVYFETFEDRDGGECCLSNVRNIWH